MAEVAFLAFYDRLLELEDKDWHLDFYDVGDFDDNSWYDYLCLLLFQDVGVDIAIEVADIADDKSAFLAFDVLSFVLCVSFFLFTF